MANLHPYSRHSNPMQRFKERRFDTPYSPFMPPYYRAMMRPFDDLDQFFGEGYDASTSGFFFAGPHVDLIEEPETFTLTAELPGMKREDIEINYDQSSNTLTLSGTKQARYEEHDGALPRRRERAFGAFSRSFTLPCEVKANKAAASYRDGVLELKLPKSDGSAKARRQIPVSS